MRQVIILAAFALLLVTEGLAADPPATASSVAVCGKYGCQHNHENNTLAPPLSAATGSDITSFFYNIFDTSKWPPRWQCGEWTAFHGWFYILSDLGIALAYFAIPFVLGIFFYKRRTIGMPFPGVVILFIAFIFSCGLTHLSDASLFWLPAYKFSALIRFITAVVSVWAVFALVRVAPAVLNYKSPEALEQIIAQRTQQLETTNASLARANSDLALANEQLQQEINQRKLAESESEMLFESIPQLAWTADPSGNLVYLNKFYKESTGIAQLDQQKIWQEILHPDDAPKAKKGWSHSIETGEPYEAQIRMRIKTGEYRWMLTRALPIRNSDNEIVKWIGTSTDIHDQKINEQRKDTFLNISSHELKTPLTIVSAYSQLIGNSPVVQNDGELRAYSEKVNFHIRKMEKLIEELLDVSRIDTGKMSYEMKPEVFEEVIKDSIQDFRSINTSRHRIELSGAAPLVVNCDRAKINQVMYNLLANAIRYSPETEPIKIRLAVANDEAICSVTDYGTGIPKGEQSKIFKKFYRTSTNTTAGGLGLGLYISSEIIKEHGGALMVESEEGVGTTFVIKLRAMERQLTPTQS